MAIYYVATTGSNTSPYDTLAKAATSPKTVVDYIQASGAPTNTIYISNGSYTGDSVYMYIDHANHADLTIIGESKAGVLLAGNYAQVRFMTNAVTGFTLSNATLVVGANTAPVSIETTSSGTFNNVDFIDQVGIARYIISCTANATFIFNKCRIFMGYEGGTDYNVYQTNGTLTFNNCMSRALGSLAQTRSWYCSAGTLNINYSHIFDTTDNGIMLPGAGAPTLNVNSSVIQGATGGAGGYCVNNSGGTATVNLTNTHLIGSLFGGGNWVNGAYNDLGGNTFLSADTTKHNADPKYISYPRKGYILPCIDDRANLGYAEDVAEKLDEYGFTGTFFVQLSNDTGSRTFSEDEKSRLRALVAGGVMEIACHSDTHSSMILADDANIWTIGTGSVTVDRTGNGTITYSGGGTVANFKTKTLAAIKAELNVLGANLSDGTIYSTTFSTGDKIFSMAYGEVIKAAGAGATAIKILVTDATEGLYKAEMTDPKAYLADTVINGAGNVVDGQTGATYVANSFGEPFNDHNSTARAAIIGALYTNGRGIDATVALRDKSYCPSIDMYGIYCRLTTSDLIGDGSESQIRRNSRALAFAVAQSGFCISILSHTTTEFTIAQWGYVLDEWHKFGSAINVTSQQLFATAVRAGWTDDLDGTFSKDYGTDGNYHPSPGSPLLRTGVAITGLTTDYDGNLIPLAGGYNIGPYNNQYVGGGLSPGLGLSGGNRPPWWNRRRR